MRFAMANYTQLCCRRSFCPVLLALILRLPINPCSSPVFNTGMSGHSSIDFKPSERLFNSICLGGFPYLGMKLYGLYSAFLSDFRQRNSNFPL
jgi:hypothetical protein